MLPAKKLVITGEAARTSRESRHVVDKHSEKCCRGADRQMRNRGSRPACRCRSFDLRDAALEDQAIARASVAARGAAPGQKTSDPTIEAP